MGTPAFQLMTLHSSHRPSMVSDLARPWEPALYEPEATCFPACPELVSHMDQGQQATGQALGEVRGNRARG